MTNQMPFYQMKIFFFFLVTLFRVGFLLSVAYLTVANLARLGILVQC